MTSVEPPKPLQRSAPVPAQADTVASIRQRRRARRRWFLVAETLSIAVLIGSVVAGISERFAADSLTPIFRLLPIAAAIVAGLLPILFFGNRSGGRG